MIKAKEALKKYTMIIVLVIVFILFAITTQGKILLPANISNLIGQNAYVFVLATGMLLCILTGGNIDLSVGSVVCFVGAVGGRLMVDAKFDVLLTMIIMLLTGIAIGAWQGFWIAYVRIPPFIVTLAGMLTFRGLSNVVLSGLTIAPMPGSFLNLFSSYIPDLLGGNKFNLTCFVVGILVCALFIFLQINNRVLKVKKGYTTEPLFELLLKTVLICAAIMWFAYNLAMHKGIPMVLIWVVLIILIYAYITSKTTIGRHFYAVGGNEKAARLSGINTNRVYFLAYVNMSMLAAVAGMITVARLNSSNPTAGVNYELDAIGSCFIGGASAYGGVGTVSGVIVGALLMGVINLGMFIMGVDADFQKVVKGLVLLAAVIFDVVSKKQKA